MAKKLHDVCSNVFAVFAYFTYMFWKHLKLTHITLQAYVASWVHLFGRFEGSTYELKKGGGVVI